MYNREHLARQLHCSPLPSDNPKLYHSTPASSQQTPNLRPNPLPPNMATDDNAQSLEKRYRAAMNGTNKNKTVRELKELLLEDQLPISHRLIAHAALARGVDDWFQREEHHLAAEQVYSEISAEVVSTSEGHEMGKRNFGPIRARLDELAEYQRHEDPGLRAAEEPTTGPTKNGKTTEE
jgi:hypothetical protein